jgi:hypothetical protein
VVPLNVNEQSRIRSGRRTNGGTKRARSKVAIGKRYGFMADFLLDDEIENLPEKTTAEFAKFGFLQAFVIVQHIS